MGTRGRRRAVLAALAVLALDRVRQRLRPEPAGRCRRLVIPTPSVDPDDFVDRRRQPLAAAADRATWTYDVSGDAPWRRHGHQRTGPTIAGRGHHRGHTPRRHARGSRRPSPTSRPGRRRQRLVVRPGGRVAGRPGRRRGRAGDGGRPAGGRRLPPGRAPRGGRRRAEVLSLDGDASCPTATFDEPGHRRRHPAADRGRRAGLLRRGDRPGAPSRPSRGSPRRS